MSSSFIQIKPIGSHAMGMLPWTNPLALLSSPDFPQARRRVSCNLFGRPERGAINEAYRQEEKQRIELFQQRFNFDILEEFPQKEEPKIKPATNIVSKATNIAESRLSGGESLIEKELREHEMKLKQQRKNCNEKLVVAAAAGDRNKSSNLKLDELKNATAAARTFVDSSKCASGHGERPKPYARQQSSMTDYYTQRKTVVCNNNRTASEFALVEESTDTLPNVLDENIETEPITTTTATSSTPAISNHESLTSSSSSSSSTAHPHPCDNESSQKQISLHTMTIGVSTELA